MMLRLMRRGGSEAGPVAALQFCRNCLLVCPEHSAESRPSAGDPAFDLLLCPATRPGLGPAAESLLLDDKRNQKRLLNVHQCVRLQPPSTRCVHLLAALRRKAAPSVHVRRDQGHGALWENEARRESRSGTHGGQHASKGTRLNGSMAQWLNRSIGRLVDWSIGRLVDGRLVD